MTGEPRAVIVTDPTGTVDKPKPVPEGQLDMFDGAP